MTALDQALSDYLTLRPRWATTSSATSPSLSGSAEPAGDRVYTQGGTKDSVDCGPSHDFALLDTHDKQQRCDDVRRIKPRVR